MPHLTMFLKNTYSKVLGPAKEYADMAVDPITKMAKISSGIAHGIKEVDRSVHDSSSRLRKRLEEESKKITRKRKKDEEDQEETKGYIENVNHFTKISEGIKDGLVKTFEKLKYVFSSVTDFIKNTWETILGDAKEYLDVVWDIGKKLVSTVLHGIRGAVVGTGHLFGNIWRGIKEGWSSEATVTKADIIQKQVEVEKTSWLQKIYNVLYGDSVTKSLERHRKKFSLFKSKEKEEDKEKEGISLLDIGLLAWSLKSFKGFIASISKLVFWATTAYNIIDSVYYALQQKDIESMWHGGADKFASNVLSQIKTLLGFAGIDIPIDTSVEAVGKLIDKAENWWNEKVVETIFEQIPQLNIVKKYYEFFKDVFTKGITSSVKEWIIVPMKGYYEKIWTFFSSTLPGSVGNLFNVLKEAFIGSAEGFLKKAGGIVDSIVDWFKSLPGKATEKAGEIGQKIIDLPGKIAQGIGSLLTGQMISPITGKFTSGFSDWRERIGYGSPGYHYGGDISAAPGTPFFAPRDLEIVATKGHIGAGGGMVYGRDPSTGLIHQFHHVNPMVTVGSKIKAGEQLGVVSNMSGPHLDWKIKNPKTGEYIDWTKGLQKQRSKLEAGQMLGEKTLQPQQKTNAANEVDQLIKRTEQQKIKEDFKDIQERSDLIDKQKEINLTVASSNIVQEKRNKQLISSVGNNRNINQKVFEIPESLTDDAYMLSMLAA
jgi:murein DD-endopeptidase MepM/ murein hydrolase activator NlpD